MKRVSITILSILAIIALETGYGYEGEAYTQVTLIHSFGLQTDDASLPFGGMLLSGETLYGMSSGGGTAAAGVVFSLETDGSNYSLLHNFGVQTDDGEAPSYGSLIAGGDTLYGMTSEGGTAGLGVIFSLGKDGGDYSILHSFGDQTDDGESPDGSLLCCGDRLYGMTKAGGPADTGVIFSLRSDGGDYSVQHSFGVQTDDGETPHGDLLLAGNSLYGITYSGGPVDGGVIFTVQTDGGGYELLHNFGAQTGDGEGPWAGSLICREERLYGMTFAGGQADSGTIFSLQTDGSNYSILHSFGVQSGDTGGPLNSGLLLLNGALYGTTFWGGQSDVGVIFSIGSDGSDYSILHGFNYTDGSSPAACLISDGGRLYGTTALGGSGDRGVIFSYVPPAPPGPTPTPFSPGYIVIESGDYSGDGISDIAIFRPSSGLWAIRDFGRVYFGASGDIPATGDYDGDGFADMAIYRPTTGLWAVRDITRLYFGGVNDTPVPGDYDGDGIADIAIFRPASGLWAQKGISRVYFGGAADRPVPADYEGNGTTAMAIFRSSTGLWAIRSWSRFYFGGEGDYPRPGDYKSYAPPGRYNNPWGALAAIFRPATGLWAVKGYSRFYYGRGGDLPVRGDFDGDSLDETGVFRSGTGLWAIRELTRAYYGTTGDIPVTR